jgi:hypothetical protein
MATFTSYTALLSKMRDELATRDWSLKKHSVDGNEFEYSSFSEFQKFFEYVELRASREQGRGKKRVRAGEGRYR